MTGVMTSEPAERTDAVSVGAVVERIAFATGASIMVLLGLVLIGAVAGELVKQRPGPWLVAFAAAGQLGYLAWATRPDRTPTRVLVVGAAFAITWITILIAGIALGQIRDTSVDGPHYQGESVRQIARGWNPLHSPELRSTDLQPLVFTNSYAKGPWYLEATVMRAGGDFESSKLVNALTAVGAVLLAYSMFRKLGRAVWLSLLGAALLGANPVVSFEIGTHMTDGLTVMVLTATFALAVFAFTKHDTRMVMPALILSLLLLVNTKATGIIMAGVMVFGTLFVAALVTRSWTEHRGLLVIVASTIVVGILVVGFNPYVMNVIRHGNPAYPVLGTTYGDQLEKFEVGPLDEDPAPIRLPISLMSRSGNVRTLKIPFTFTTGEWKIFQHNRPTVGGFGPLFGGALLLAALASAVALIRRPRERNSPLTNLVLIGAALGVISALLIPVASSARLGPQVWMVPILAMLAVSGATQTRSSVRVLAVLVLAVLMVNAAGVAALAVRGQRIRSSELDASLRRVRALPGPLDAEFGVWPSAEQHRLSDAGIRFTARRNVTCADGYLLTAGSRLVRVNSSFIKRPVSGTLLCPAAPIG